MTVHINAIISTVFSCVTPDYSFIELEKLMDKQGIRCVPIIETVGRCMRDISILDVLHWRLAQLLFGESVIAHYIITQPLESVETGSSVEQAVEIMESKNIHHGVVEKNGKGVRTLSAIDLLKSVYDKSRATKLCR